MASGALVTPAAALMGCTQTEKKMRKGSFNMSETGIFRQIGASDV
jgi:hypothetical protein